MMDWKALGEETIDLLRRYLTIDTTNPPGRETDGARFLAAALEGNGIASETAESAEGRGNLVARVKGDGSGVDITRARVPLKRDLICLATADEEAGSRFGAQWIADHRAHWLDGAEYAISELGFVATRHDARAPLGTIVISEKTGLSLRLTARGEPGHGSMPWPDTAPHRLISALGRLLQAERSLRVLPEIREYFRALASVLPGEAGRGLDDVERSLADPAFRARFLANPHHAALVRTTFAVNMLKGSEKRNVIPPEAVAEVDCRCWPVTIERVVADAQVAVEITGEAKQPNLSPPDTELYKHLADTLRRRAPGVVVTPEILVAFTDNWVFRRMGLHGYGWSPFVCDEGELRRIHGNDERLSLENIREGVRAYTEMLLAAAAA